jgi:SAM-dependent methyltransferase
MTTHISMRETQFRYFDKLLDGPVWKGSKVLDFGGNVGGFLVDSEDRVDHNDYWCLDVTQGAIQQGQSKFPRAHFLFYNRYASYFNPNGIRNLPVPDLGVKFDIIMAFSVFTHTHQREMLELVEQLRDKLSPQGVLAFTFMDPSYDRSLSVPGVPSGTGLIRVSECQLPNNLSPEIARAVEAAVYPRWCAGVDDTLYLEPGDELCQQNWRDKPYESYCSYFTAGYMASLFPDATVHPPVSPEWQHCCLIRNKV